MILFFFFLQLLTIIGPFLERRQIRQIFNPNLVLLQQYFREELEKCKTLFKSWTHQVCHLIVLH